MELVKSAHDCSEGGLAVALAECCISGPKLFGASIDLGPTPLRTDVALFNESQSRIIISVNPADLGPALALLIWRNLPYQQLGTVTDSDCLEIKINETPLAWNVSHLSSAWTTAIPDLMKS